MLEKRILILGTSGSGKTTFAKALSKKIKTKHYDLDDIMWARKYDKKRNKQDRLKLLKKICNNKKWIVEGAYHKWIEPAVAKSDLVIILDLNKYELFRRVLIRHFNRRRNTRENFKDVVSLLKYISKYKKQFGGYYIQKDLIRKHKVHSITLRNSKEIKNFLSNASRTVNQ